ncbi:MAG: hypothetical protein R2697_15650 [Ilumatobacteraceae bacterium]
MLARAFSILLVWLTVAAAGATVAAQGEQAPPGTPPPSTFNVFYPEERPLSDCLSSLPKPNCGSDARGGWAQYAIAIALVAGLSFIGWRVVRSARRTGDRRTPAATSVPDADGGGPAP